VESEHHCTSRRVLSDRFSPSLSLSSIIHLSSYLLKLSSENYWHLKQRLLM
jgi:hypothetical protein